MFKLTNPNPHRHTIDDCVIRAIAIATGHSWDYIYIALTMRAYDLKAMPSTNFVWDGYLRDIGYKRNAIPDMCPDCYTIEEFCKDHPKGSYTCSVANTARRSKTNDIGHNQTIEEKEKSDGIGGDIQNKPKE